MVSQWPRANQSETDDDVAEVFSLIQDITTGIRNVKSQKGVAPSHEVSAHISLGRGGAQLAERLSANSRYIERLSRANTTIGVDIEKPPASIPVVVGRHQVFIPLAGLLDIEEERARLEKEIAQKESFLQSVRKKLQNEQFLRRAPADVVAREQQKETDAVAELDKLRENLHDLEA